MGYAVIDASYYPSAQLGIPAQMIKDALSEQYDPSGRDGALVSSVHPQQAIVMERIARKYPAVFVGGAGALSPGAYESATGVVVGDYQAFVATLLRDPADALALPNIYHPSHPSPTGIDQKFPYHLSGRYVGEDGRTTLFCSRGCRRRCAFCQTGWALEYSEHPEPEQIINAAPGHHNYVSNAISDLSYFDRLPVIDGASHTIARAIRHPRPGRLIRVGVEGVSERLRRAVGKPISNEHLVDWTLALNNRGVQVRWFLIAGLPDEAWDDWLELMDCVKAYTTSHRKGTLQVSFTAYVPEPSTPIKDLPYSDDYFGHYERFADWYFDKARIAHLSIFRPQGVAKRAAKAATQVHPNNALVAYPHRARCASALHAYKRAMQITRREARR